MKLDPVVYQSKKDNDQWFWYVDTPAIPVIIENGPFKIEALARKDFEYALPPER